MFPSGLLEFSPYPAGGAGLLSISRSRYGWNLAKSRAICSIKWTAKCKSEPHTNLEVIEFRGAVGVTTNQTAYIMSVVKPYSWYIFTRVSPIQILMPIVKFVFELGEFISTLNKRLFFFSWRMSVSMTIMLSYYIQMRCRQCARWLLQLTAPIFRRI